jgi:hypothetical protein
MAARSKLTGAAIHRKCSRSAMFTAARTPRHALRITAGASSSPVLPRSPSQASTHGLCGDGRGFFPRALVSGVCPGTLSGAQKKAEGGNLHR